MAEWLKAHAWKACLPYGNEGSNPSPSSKIFSRFINNQSKQGYIQLTQKPTTIAMNRFKEHKLTMVEKGVNDVTEEAVKASVAEVAPTAEAVAEASDAAADAF